MAGEVAVRDYVSETPRDKPRAQLRRLRVAMLEEQHAAGGQVQRGLLKDVLQVGKRVGSGRQRCRGLMAQTVRVQYGIIGRDVGWIADDEFEALLAERREPTAGSRRPAPRAAPGVG